MAFRRVNVDFRSFNVFGSIAVVQYAVLGGIGWTSGALVGASLASGTLLSARRT